MNRGDDPESVAEPAAPGVLASCGDRNVRAATNGAGNACVLSQRLELCTYRGDRRVSCLSKYGPDGERLRDTQVSRLTADGAAWASRKSREARRRGLRRLARHPRARALPECSGRSVADAVADARGRRYVAGTVDDYRGRFCSYVLRYSADGERDRTFRLAARERGAVVQDLKPLALAAVQYPGSAVPLTRLLLGKTVFNTDSDRDAFVFAADDVTGNPDHPPEVAGLQLAWTRH